MNRIDQTKEAIRNRGWIQRSYNEPDGYCLVGAMGTTGMEYYDIYRYPDLREVAYVIDEQYGPKPCYYTIWSRITEWNDAPDRTLDEVISVLEKASIRYEEKKGL